MSPFLNIKVPLNKEDYKSQILNYDKLHLPGNIKISVLKSYYLSNLNDNGHKQFDFMKILIQSKFYTMDPSSSKKLFYYSNQIDSQIKNSNII
jgi:hypothetical protein